MKKREQTKWRRVSAVIYDRRVAVREKKRVYKARQ